MGDWCAGWGKSLTLAFVGLYASVAFAAHPSDQSQSDLFMETLPAIQQQWLNEHPQINVAAMSDWPPINFENSKGQPDGIGADYIAALNKRLGGRLRLRNGEWSVIYQQVADRELDVLMDITPKPERQNDFNFTIPYLEIPHVIITQDSAAPVENEDDLKGKTVALEQGFGNVLYFQTNYPEVKIREYANTSQAIGAVIVGEADAYVGNRAVALHIINRELMTGLKIQGRVKKSGSILTLGVRKDWTILSEILNRALDDITPAEASGIQRYWVGDIGTGKAESRVELSGEEQAWLHDHPVIRLASDADWPPYEYFDKDGHYQGIAADYMSILGEKLGVEFQVSPIAPWSEIVDKVRDRELDVLSLAMATPERLEFARFTKPYVTNTAVIVTRNNVSYIAGLDGLKGKQVALEKGYALVDIIGSENPDIIIDEYPTTAAALNAVAKGKSFAYVGNIATTSYQIRENSLSNLVISDEVKYRYELAMGVRSDWPILVGILDKGLDSISAQERADIFSRWIQVSVTKGLPIIWFVTAGGGALLVVLIVLYWNFQLNRTVQDRTRLLEHRALHDSLTDLPNRNAILTQMQQMLSVSQRNQCLLAVFFLDLDDFKKVNDTLGHRVGDLLLLAVADRLRRCMRRSDVIGRLGGDEFVIVTGQVNSVEQIQQIAQNLLAQLQDSFELEGQSLMMTTSLGIAIFPNDSDDSHKLLEKADTAMYHAKKKGGNELAFFDHQMNISQQKKVAIENHFFTALENGEFSLVYQPIIESETQRPKGFEALLRWHSPQLGFVSPDEFIPIAEQNGFILHLGKFVLQQSCWDLRQLKAAFDPRLTMSINLSPRQVRDIALLEQIESVLQQQELAVTDLIFEITEGVLLSHEQQSARVLNELTELGVLIAMDDFGTGYSSLSYVRNYPFNSLKIDREFVRDMATDNKDQQLVEATIMMANSLNMAVVAEGVENDAQYQALRHLGCHYLQGYLFSKPLPFVELKEWLNQQVELTQNG